MRNFFSFFAIFFLNNIPAIYSSTTVDHNPTDLRRAADTCADSTLAQTYVETYSPSEKSHLLQLRSEFVITNTVGNGDFGFQGEIFLAWQTAQNFTVPLYRLFNPTTLDYIFVMSTNGNTPTVSGFELSEIPAYVYPTQICGSVPLFVVSRASAGDHWYTTNMQERDEFVSSGWADQGIAAFVLPLTSDCACSS